MIPIKAMQMRRQSGAASGYAATVLSIPGLWGYWKLDESSPLSGSSVADASPNSRNGSYQGTWPNASPLFTGSILAKDAGLRISLPDYTVAASPKFSLCGFISTLATGSTTRAIMSADNGSTNRRWQFRMMNGRLQFVFIQPSTVTIQSVALVNDGGPHFVAVVYDESLSAGSGRLKIYIDGALDTASTTSVTMTPGIANVAIGSRSSVTNADPWVGQFDDMFIVDGAISAAQVSSLWAARNMP